MLKKAREQAKAEAEGKAAPDPQGKDVADSVLESSRQIWLAGLGAFARAQEGGRKVFEALVQQGQALESRTKQAAGDTANAAREAAQAKAKEMQAKAGGTWDKLEQVFEERVQRSLKRLGVLTRDEVADLNQGVRDLADQMRELMAQQAAAGKGAEKKKARKRAAKRATRGSRARRA